MQKCEGLCFCKWTPWQLHRIGTSGTRRAAQGRYMTMSEVKGNFRNSILIPEIGWENFRDVLDD